MNVLVVFILKGYKLCLERWCLTSYTGGRVQGLRTITEQHFQSIWTVITFLKNVNIFRTLSLFLRLGWKKKGGYSDVIPIISMQKISPPFINLYLAFLKMPFQLGCLEEMLIEGRALWSNSLAPSLPPPPAQIC